eukprot:6863912-Pyramimonas_sp.AAC.1
MAKPTVGSLGSAMMFGNCLDARQVRLTDEKSGRRGVVLRGSHATRSWHAAQSAIALLPGDAEYHGIVIGASVGLGLQFALKDLDVQRSIAIESDATAVVAFVGRRGR